MTIDRKYCVYERDYICKIVLRSYDILDNITNKYATLQSKAALCKCNHLELLPADEEGHMVSADIVVIINSILNDLLFCSTQSPLLLGSN
jgi:hypothetical protein